MLVNANGRSPRIRRASRSITREIGAHKGSEVNLVDDQQVTTGDARPPLARDSVACGDVDDVDRQIGELRAEGRGEIVAAAFDQDDVERRETPAHVRDPGEIDAHPRGSRCAAAGDLDDDALWRQEPGRAGSCVPSCRCRW